MSLKLKDFKERYCDRFFKLRDGMVAEIKNPAICVLKCGGHAILIQTLKGREFYLSSETLVQVVDFSDDPLL